LNTTWRYLAGIVLAAMLHSTIAAAQQYFLPAEKISEIDAFVEERVRALEIPGAALVLIDNGEIVYAKGYGLTQKNGTPVSEKTPFEVGSVSKSFTALAIMQLVDEGNLNLDDPVVKHIPWFQTSNKEVSDKITVRHLLAHRSGLSTLVGNRNQHGGSNSPDAMVGATRELSSVALKTLPGAHYEYSNANYHILGLLLEVLDNDSFENIIENRVVTADLMPNSYVRTRPRMEPAPAKGHRYWFTRPIPFELPRDRETLGGGGITASAEDLANYILNYMHSGIGDKHTGMAAMMTPYEDAPGSQYGLGWFIRNNPDYRVVFHGGQNVGFECAVLFSPDAKFGYVLLTNTNSSFGSRDVGSLVWGVAPLIMNLPPPDKTPYLIERITRGAVYIVLIFLLIQIVSFVRKIIGKRLEPVRKGKSFYLSYLRLFMPSIFLTGLAYILLILLPRMNGAPMSAVSVFMPDMALLLKFSGTTALAWALVRPVLRVRFQRVCTTVPTSGPEQRAH